MRSPKKWRGKPFKEKADKEWRLAILTIHPWCVVCRFQRSTDAHHIVTRANLWTRHAIENGLGLCAACHRYWHEYPSHSESWLEAELPDYYRWYILNRQLIFKRPDFEQKFRDLEAINALLRQGYTAYWEGGQIIYEMDV